MKFKYISFILVVFFLFILVQPQRSILADETVDYQYHLMSPYSNISVWNKVIPDNISLDSLINKIDMHYQSTTGHSMDYILLGVPCDSFVSGGSSYAIDGLKYYLFTYDSNDIVSLKDNKFYYNNVEMYKYNASEYNSTACCIFNGFYMAQFSDGVVNVSCSSYSYGNGNSILSSICSGDSSFNLNLIYENAVLKKASNVKGISDIDNVITDFDDMPLNSLFITSPVNNASLKSYFEDNNFIDITLKGKIVYSDIQVDIIDMLLSLFGCDDVKDYVIEAIEENMRFSLTFNLLDEYLDEDLNNVSTRRIVSPKVKIYGSKEDWIKNGYINFKVDGRVDIDSSLASRSNGFSIVSMCSFYENMFTVTSNSVNLLCHRWIDANGDKIDDITGEKITANIVYDRDGPDGDLPPEDITKGNQNEMFFEDQEGFFPWLSGIVSEIGNFFSVSADTLGSVTTDVGDMTHSIWNFFEFLPSPIPSLIKISFLLIIFIVVIRYIRG